MTLEIYDSTFGGRRAVTLENLVRLVVMQEALKLQSKMVYHIDGS